MTTRKLEELQVSHSEMLATAHDLGVSVPHDLTLDFSTVEVGQAACNSLDALIREFRTGLDAKSETNQGGRRSSPRTEEKTMSETTDTTTARRPRKSAGKAKKAVRKTAKKAATKKVAKASGNGAARSVAGDERRITVLKKGENPYTEGTARGNLAAAVLASNGKTVGEAKKRGADSWVIRKMTESKHIKVSA